VHAAFKVQSKVRDVTLNRNSELGLGADETFL